MGKWSKVEPLEEMTALRRAEIKESEKRKRAMRRKNVILPEETLVPLPPKREVKSPGALVGAVIDCWGKRSRANGKISEDREMEGDYMDLLFSQMER